MLKSSSTPEASCWLSHPPSLLTALTNVQFRTAVQLRLGANVSIIGPVANQVCTLRRCRTGNAAHYIHFQDGSHTLQCFSAHEKKKERHDNIVTLIAFFFQSIGLTVEKEFPLDDLFGSYAQQKHEELQKQKMAKHKRFHGCAAPGDLTKDYNEQIGKKLGPPLRMDLVVKVKNPKNDRMHVFAFDFTSRSSTCRRDIAKAAEDPDHVLIAAEKGKVQKYGDLFDKYGAGICHLVPFAMDTSGRWGPTAIKEMKKILDWTQRWRQENHNYAAVPKIADLRLQIAVLHQRYNTSILLHAVGRQANFVDVYANQLKLTRREYLQRLANQARTDEPGVIKAHLATRRATLAAVPAYEAPYVPLTRTQLVAEELNREYPDDMDGEYNREVAEAILRQERFQREMEEALVECIPHSPTEGDAEPEHRPPQLLFVETNRGSHTHIVTFEIPALQAPHPTCTPTPAHPRDDEATLPQVATTALPASPVSSLESPLNVPLATDGWDLDVEGENAKLQRIPTDQLTDGVATDIEDILIEDAPTTAPDSNTDEGVIIVVSPPLLAIMDGPMHEEEQITAEAAKIQGPTVPAAQPRQDAPQAPSADENMRAGTVSTTCFTMVVGRPDFSPRNFLPSPPHAPRGQIYIFIPHFLFSLPTPLLAIKDAPDGWNARSETFQTPLHTSRDAPSTPPSTPSSAPSDDPPPPSAASSEFQDAQGPPTMHNVWESTYRPRPPVHRHTEVYAWNDTDAPSTLDGRTAASTPPLTPSNSTLSAEATPPASRAAPPTPPPQSLAPLAPELRSPTASTFMSAQIQISLVGTLNTPSTFSLGDPAAPNIPSITALAVPEAESLVGEDHADPETTPPTTHTHLTHPLHQPDLGPAASIPATLQLNANEEHTTHANSFRCERPVTVPEVPRTLRPGELFFHDPALMQYLRQGHQPPVFTRGAGAPQSDQDMHCTEQPTAPARPMAMILDRAPVAPDSVPAQSTPEPPRAYAHWPPRRRAPTQNSEFLTHLNAAESGRAGVHTPQSANEWPFSLMHQTGHSGPPLPSPPNAFPHLWGSGNPQYNHYEGPQMPHVLPSPAFSSLTSVSTPSLASNSTSQPWPRPPLGTIYFAKKEDPGKKEEVKKDEKRSPLPSWGPSFTGQGVIDLDIVELDPPTPQNGHLGEPSGSLHPPPHPSAIDSKLTTESSGPSKLSGDDTGAQKINSQVGQHAPPPSHTPNITLQDEDMDKPEVPTNLKGEFVEDSATAGPPQPTGSTSVRTKFEPDPPHTPPKSPIHPYAGESLVKEDGVPKLEHESEGNSNAPGAPTEVPHRPPEVAPPRRSEHPSSRAKGPVPSRQRSARTPRTPSALLMAKINRLKAGLRPASQVARRSGRTFDRNPARHPGPRPRNAAPRRLPLTVEPVEDPMDTLTTALVTFVPPHAPHEVESLPTSPVLSAARAPATPPNPPSTASLALLQDDSSRAVSGHFQGHYAPPQPPLGTEKSAARPKAPRNLGLCGGEGNSTADCPPLLRAICDRLPAEETIGPDDQDLPQHTADGSERQRAVAEGIEVAARLLFGGVTDAPPSRAQSSAPPPTEAEAILRFRQCLARAVCATLHQSNLHPSHGTPRGHRRGFLTRERSDNNHVDATGGHLLAIQDREGRTHPSNHNSTRTAMAATRALSVVDVTDGANLPVFPLPEAANTPSNALFSSPLAQHPPNPQLPGAIHQPITTTNLHDPPPPLPALTDAQDFAPHPPTFLGAPP